MIKIISFVSQSLSNVIMYTQTPPKLIKDLNVHQQAQVTHELDVVTTSATEPDEGKSIGFCF